MAAIIKIYHLFNPIIFAIPQYLWAPYHNFSVYGSWYNYCSYTWAHSRVPTNTRLQYQNILASYSTVISTSRFCIPIMLHENYLSSQGGDHASRICYLFYFIVAKNLLCSFSISYDALLCDCQLFIPKKFCEHK